MGDMSPFRRSHEPGRPDHRPGTPEAEGRQREARTLDGSGGLDASLVRAGLQHRGRLFRPHRLTTPQLTHLLSG